jgi:hypothetical protein
MKVLTLLSVTLLAAQSLLAAPRGVPKGFATTNGQSFEVDGKPFVCLDLSSSLIVAELHLKAFVGANSYVNGCTFHVVCRADTSGHLFLVATPIDIS